MDLPDVEPDLSPWGIPTADAQVQRSSRGTNNDVRIVGTTQGRLVWRKYENLSTRQVSAEHRLLQWLDSRDLPFSVSVPLRTMSGTTFAELPYGGVTSVHAFIPGDRPNDTDREIALTATAFAQLLLTLADAPSELAPRNWSTTRLCDIHPGLPAPEELLTCLAEHDVDLGWLADTLDSERDLQRRLDALPQQIVHGDVAQSNALTDGAQVTGLLDFEIAGFDARVSDVGTALHSLGGDPATEDGRARIRAVREHFGRKLDLQAGEIDVLPEVVRQRLAGSVLWRAGRWLQGRAHDEEVVSRVRDGADHVAHLGSYRSTVRSHRSA